MTAIFDAINQIFSFIQPVSDFLWEFPANMAWYANIPILGNFSLAIILLVGSGIFFSFKTGFIQITHFRHGLRTLLTRKAGSTGISPLAAFFLSSAMRVGPGNILGVTGAIAVGGPGSLFWMWVSAFFGMATAYVESVLAQIFKEKKEDEFVGGLPFYGKRLLKNSSFMGILLSLIFILYALCCLPAQAFNVISSTGQMAEIITGKRIPQNSVFYYSLAVILVVVAGWIAFGGIKKVTRVTDKIVPVMAVIYCLTVLSLILINFKTILFFFYAVFTGAFQPEAVFGGVFGTVLVQGVKRGLMSNEAGQGTITMAAAASDAQHPCDQGCVQAIGVFLDTMVICTLTGFVIVMAHLWSGAESADWMALDRLPKFLQSAAELTPGSAFQTIVIFLICLCFCLFAFTTLMGMISFSEIAANRIRKDKKFIQMIRGICIFVVIFGILCNLAGLDLGNLWAFSDLGNIIIVYANIPILYLGMKYVMQATKHFKKQDGTRFDSSVIGIDCEYWKSKNIN